MSNNTNIVIAQSLMMRIKDYAERALDKKDVTLDIAMVEIRDTADAYDEYFHGDVNDEVVEAYEDYYSD